MKIFALKIHCAPAPFIRPTDFGNDTRAFERHTGIMHDLIETSDYPEIGYQELGAMLGRSRAAALHITRPVLTRP